MEQDGEATPPEPLGPHLKQIYAFGFERIPGKDKQFVCVDQDTIAYPLGCSLVMHSLSEKTMQFIAMAPAVEGIVGVTATPSGTLVAVCQKMKSGPGQVSIVDTKKFKILQTLTSTSTTELEVCALSKNELRAVAVTKNLKGSLICWELLHGKVLTSIPIFVDITAVTINPHDGDEFATSGPSHFRVWSLKGGTTKSCSIPGLEFNNNEKVTVNDHNWLKDGAIAVATADNLIYIVRDGALQSKLTDTGNTLRLVATAEGFLTGTSDGTVMEFKARGRPPVFSGTALTNVRGPISCLAVPPNVQARAYVQQEGRLLKLNYEDFESEGEKDVIDLHVIDLAAVCGMDLCVRRRLIATCSTDKVVRIWSYCRILCDISHTCDEQPTSIAISPWGYELLVGMSSSSICIFGIMANRLEPRKEIALQGCGQMKYSPNGSAVAILCGRDIVLYSSFTWEVVAVLKAHIGKVTSIAWSSSSVHLVSAGLDGAVYTWSMDDLKRHEECVTKGSQYSCALYDLSRTFLYTAGRQLPLRTISTSKEPPSDVLNTFPKDSLAGVYESGPDGIYRGCILCELNEQPHYSQLVGYFQKRLLFAISADSQALHAYAYPFTSNTAAPVLKFLPQAGRVAGLCVDEKHNIVFVRTANGTIFICTLEDDRVSGSGTPSLRDLFEGSRDEDEIIDWLLVKRTDISDIEQEVQDLRSSLQAEQDESRYRQHRIRQDWTAKIKEKEKEAAKRERQLAQEIITLKEKLELAEKNLEGATQNMLASQSQEISSLYAHFEEKFTGETARAEHWRSQAEKVKEDCLKEVESKENEHMQEVDNLQNRIKTTEEEALARLQKFEAECDKEIRKYKTYMEEDLVINDEEIFATRAQMKQALMQHQRHMEETRSQMLLEKKAATSYQMQISELTTLCASQEANIRGLEIEKSRLENFALEFDYKKRILDKLVEEADEHRKALLHATKERETLAALQHSKIQQLIEREKPLVAEIAQLKAKIQEMMFREALDAKHKMVQEEAVKLLKERIIDLEQHGFKLLDQLHQKEDFLNAFKEALCVIVQDHDPVEWPPLTRGLFLAYVKGSERAAVAEGLESRSQIMKQRQILEDFVVVLKNTIERTKERSKEEIQHFVRENLNLLRDFCETNRNVRRMAFMVQKLQQQVAYFKGIVSMQKRTLVKQGQAQQPRRSVTTPPPRRASAPFITTGIQKQMRRSQESDAFTMPAMRTPTPVSEILKPYSRFSIIHDGDQDDQTRRMTSQQIERRMSKPWAQEPERGCSSVVTALEKQVEELTKELNESKADCARKQQEIESWKSQNQKKPFVRPSTASAASGRPRSSLGFSPSKVSSSNRRRSTSARNKTVRIEGM